MCGRATLSSPAEAIAEIFDVTPVDIGPARYNIAPTQPIVTVRAAGDDPGDGRALAVVRWGLIPWWAKPDEAKRIAARCIQARAETAPRMPAFRDAFKRQRCLVVFDGFYEWLSSGEQRIPHHTNRPDGEPFAIAGLWDSWKDKSANDHERIESATVLTTRSGGALREVHDRMPLVLSREEWDVWLHGTPEEASALLRQDGEALDARAAGLVAEPVSLWVNDVKHEDPRCAVPVSREEVEGELAAKVKSKTRKKKR